MSDIRINAAITLEAHLGILHLNIPSFQGFTGTKNVTIYCDEVSVIDDSGQNLIQLDQAMLQVFNNGANTSATVTLDANKKTASISGVSFSGLSGKMLMFSMTGAQGQGGNTFFFQGFCQAVIP